MARDTLLGLTEDQELLRDAATKFIASACSLAAVRALLDTEVGMSDSYLADTAELGWYAPLVSEEYGGGTVSGVGVVDLAVIAEERGRSLQPGPFVSMNVVAAAVAAAGSPAQMTEVLPAIVAGDAVATWALSDPGNQLNEVTATRDGEQFVLSGRAGLVEHGRQATWVLLTTEAEAPTQFLIPANAAGVTVTAFATHDITRRFASVDLDDVRVGPESIVGEFGAASSQVGRQLQLALVLNVAETIGALDALFEMTCEYAQDRIAFGRPIGSFQAVKHQLADLSLLLEAAKAVTAAAVDAVQAERTDAAEIASLAKAWVGDAGIDIVQGASQIFGGIGQTWEHDLHLYLRRVTMNTLLYGRSDWHRERICSLHALSGETHE